MVAENSHMTMIKVVYFDEESASDFLDISTGGKEVATREQVQERLKEAHARTEMGVFAKLSWLPFLGGSADLSTGAEVSAAGKSILSKTLSNTILTDYMAKAEGDTRIARLRGLRVSASKDSMAYMKMFTPYMVVLKMDDIPVDLARMDEMLVGAKGYYELIGESDDGVKRVLRFNLKAFRNNYGLTDLGRMRLIFHGILVGSARERDLGMAVEMSGGVPPAALTAAEIVDGVADQGGDFLDVFDILLAGVEHG